MLQHKKTSHKWHLRYMQMARLVSNWSKHPEFQVGAVATGDFGQILSTGFNGWPRGVVDEENGRDRTNRSGFSYSIHAEANVIYNANLNGTSLKGASVYVYPMFPCVECAKALVQVGVTDLVYEHELPTERQPLAGGIQVDPKWIESWQRAQDMMHEAGVNMINLSKSTS